MDIVEGIKFRKSVRGYNSLPVPKKILSEILEVSTRAPSSLNVQPWEFTIVAGEVLNNFRQANVKMFESGVSPTPGVPGQECTGIYRQRQKEQASQIFELMGISWDDRAKRKEWDKGTFRFHNAPAVIIISADMSLNEVPSMFNIGLITQTIALAALNYDLGTCIQDVMYPDIARRFTGIPESKLIIISVSIGYPDWEFPANRLQSQREPYENITTWHGI